MEGATMELVFYLLQTVSTFLILICLWLARTLWTKVKELEENQVSHRLELERKIANLELATTTRIVKLEQLGT